MTTTASGRKIAPPARFSPGLTYKCGKPGSRRGTGPVTGGSRPQTRRPSQQARGRLVGGQRPRAVGNQANVQGDRGVQANVNNVDGNITGASATTRGKGATRRKKLVADLSTKDLTEIVKAAGGMYLTP